MLYPDAFAIGRIKVAVAIGYNYKFATIWLSSFLRCVQIGLSLSKLDLLMIEVVNDMFTEKENDEYNGWSEVAGQADFDAF